MFRPGKNIRNYLINDRNQLVKPIFFLILKSLIYTFITHYFQVEEKYVAANDLQNTASGRMLIWIQSNYGYANMIMGVFIAFWLRIIFKKYQYNFYELLVMLCYLFGFSMLIFTLFAVIEGLIYVKVFKFAAWISIVYVVWAIGNFFDARKISSYLRSLLAFILGTITFYILLFSAGIVIDWIVE